MAIEFKEHIRHVIQTNRLDAKYFRPDFVKIENSIKNHLYYKELDQLVREIIHPTEIPRDLTTTKETESLFLLVKNLDELFIDVESEKRFVKNDAIEQLQKNKVEEGDLLLTRTGDVKNLSVFHLTDYKNVYASSHILILKPYEKDMAYYIATFLKTTYGQKLLRRRVYGAVQPETSPMFIRTIPVPIINEIKDEIIGNYKKSLELINQSEKKYKEAEELLYKYLNINIANIKLDRSYKVPLKSLIEKDRFDPLSFNPSYNKILSNLKFDYLGNLVKQIEKGIEIGSDNYKEEGQYLFLRVTNLSKWGIKTNKDTKYIEESLFKDYQHFIPQKEDILFTKDGTVGTAYKVREDSLKCIVSSGILRLKTNEGKINSSYIELVLNSFVGKIQSEMNIRGSNIPHLYLLDILKFRIPRLDEKVELAIANKADEAITKRKKAVDIIKNNVSLFEETIAKRLSF